MLNHLRTIFSAAPLMMHRFNGPTLPTATNASHTLATASSTETAIFANGCFWGTEHMFRHHFVGKGLTDAKVGYIGGKTSDPTYRDVCSGATGHAEAVKLFFDPSKVSYAELVEFNYRTHDPTHVDRQGPDRGTQYRTAIFTNSKEQDEIARKVTAEVKATHYPRDSIATTIQTAGEWFDAEDYHQKYLNINPGGYECPTHVLHW